MIWTGYQQLQVYLLPSKIYFTSELYFSDSEMRSPLLQLLDATEKALMFSFAAMSASLENNLIGKVSSLGHSASVTLDSQTRLLFTIYMNSCMLNIVK